MNEIDVLLLSGAVNPLLQWYEGNARVLPWRQQPTPYRVWVSEIMLQQTRVSAVMPYFQRWMEALPEIRDLAQAEEETLLKLWEGLGYYNRVRNLQKAAKIIMTEHDGNMPSEYALLLQLPGIGEYTAGAISSIAFGQDEVAVDGNVLRVISRMLGSFRDIKEPETKKDVQQLLRVVLPSGKASAFNQALMELGATVCLPNGAPQCMLCPWAENCRAHEAGNELMIPVKTPKKQRRIEEKTVFLCICGNRVAIGKRPAKGLLARLWELPSAAGFLTREQAEKYLQELHIETAAMEKTAAAKHIFTHIEWHMQGYLVETKQPAGEFLWVSWEELQQQYALPSAFKAYVSVLEKQLS
ncbi:MAG: A/G-specific adenine glycosylase [Clostridia bacterium]|nr:A/G-specific adenine glycosylase [Clostridia bacterium]